MAPAPTSATEQRLGVLTTFVAPQFRTQVNFTMATAPEVVAEADEDLLALLGFKIWNAYGRIESPVAGYIQAGRALAGGAAPKLVLTTDMVKASRMGSVPSCKPESRGFVEIRKLLLEQLLSSWRFKPGLRRST